MTTTEASAEQAESTPAQVLTLEASVRVLRVGNRQITQSVAKQLDVVSFRNMKPMGRVRVDSNECAIGRSLESGDLVLATVHKCSQPHHGGTSYGERRKWHECAECGCQAVYRDPGRNVFCPDYETRPGAYDDIAALPLIVLAGLR